MLKVNDMGRRIWTAFLISNFLLLGFPPPPVAQPPLPSSFYGLVIANGNPTAEGISVTAWIGGEQWAGTMVTSYQGNLVYSIDVPGDDPLTPESEGGVEGDTIHFYVGDRLVLQLGTWHSGTDIGLSLTVGSTEAERLYLPLILKDFTTLRSSTRGG